MFELMDSYSQSAVIKVLGVGGGGGNAVSHMVQAGLEGFADRLQHHQGLGRRRRPGSGPAGRDGGP